MNIAKFALAGGLNTLFAYVVYILLIMGGMKYLHALIVDYIIGIFSGYLINYYWVFTSQGNHALKFIKYLFIYIGVFFIYLTLIIIVKHAENIKRLLNKTESKIKLSK